MILDGIAGAVAANTVIKTAVAMSGLTSILNLVSLGNLYLCNWCKLFPDKKQKFLLKKFNSSWFCSCTWFTKIFCSNTNMMIPIIFLTQFWIFAGLIISTKQVLNLKSNIKSFGIVFLSFLIIAFLSISFVMSRMNMLPVNQIS